MKNEIISFEIIYDMIKLATIIYDFKDRFIFDLDNNTTTLLKNLDFENINIKNTNKIILKEICNDSPDGKLLHFYDNNINDLQAATTISHYHKRITIVFRGSSSIKDWLHNIIFYKTKLENDIYVHKGFYKQLMEHQFCEKIIEDIKNILKIYKSYDIYITGHSMGGALASIFGYILSKMIDNDNTVISFASQRVGNKTWNYNFNYKHNLRHYRIVNNRDIISRIPYINYYHVGNTIILKSNDYIFKSYYEVCDNFYNCVLFYFSRNDHKQENYYKKIKSFVNKTNINLY